MYQLCKLQHGKTPALVRSYKTIEGARKALDRYPLGHFIQYTPQAVEQAGAVYHGPRDAHCDVPLALARGLLPKSTRSRAHG